LAVVTPVGNGAGNGIAPELAPSGYRLPLPTGTADSYDAGATAGEAEVAAAPGRSVGFDPDPAVPLGGAVVDPASGEVPVPLGGGVPIAAAGAGIATAPAAGGGSPTAPAAAGGTATASAAGAAGAALPAAAGGAGAAPPAGDATAAADHAGAHFPTPDVLPVPLGQRRAADILPALVHKPWKQLARLVDALGDEPPDEALHEVRILAKRVRYAAEAVVGVVGKPARALAVAVAEVQGVLGDMQDAVVAETWLRHQVATNSSTGQAMVAGQLVTVQRQQQAACRHGWKGPWKAASHKRLRAWLKPDEH
jgi:hypothetical protein